MEPKTKKIVAIVLIVIIAVGIGLGAWAIATPRYGQVQTGILVTPGAPEGTTEDQVIKIGVLGSLTEIQGESQWYGVYMAVEELNQAGGVLIDGKTYYFGLIGEDTYESDPYLDVSKGVAAAQKMVQQNKPNFIIGGFRTEAVLAYQEVIMDAETIFIDTGAATDIFTENVGKNYNRYKYFFRTMPISSSNLAKEILQYLGYLRVYMSVALNKPVTKVAIIREDLSWTIPMTYLLNGKVPGAPGLEDLGWEITTEIAYPITATSSDFATYWQQIQDTGAQLVVPIISAQGGILMTTQYAQTRPKCLIAGIDVMSQLGNYWQETGGGCEHEVVLQSTIRTNKTARTVEVWDKWVSLYGDDPLYTGLGAYDSVYMLYYAIQTIGSFDTESIIKVLEGIDEDNYVVGASGNIAFTDEHDVVEGYNKKTDVIYGVTLFVQWQAGGKKECVSTGGLVYPERVVTAPLTFPSWGIN